MNNRIRMAAGATALVAVLSPASALAATAAPAPGGPPPSKAVLRLDRDTTLADAKVRVDSPGYAADVVDWVKCMNAKGLPTTVTATGITAGGWTFGAPTTRRARFLESLAGENARDRVEDVCLVRAFGL